MRRTAANTAQYAPLSRLFVAVRTPSPTQSRRRRGRCVGDHADGPYKLAPPAARSPMIVRKEPARRVAGPRARPAVNSRSRSATSDREWNPSDLPLVVRAGRF
jgi:hypothetical protein